MKSLRRACVQSGRTVLHGSAVAGIPYCFILKAIPGQENANMKKFSHCGMSISTKTVKKAVKRRKLSF